MAVNKNRYDGVHFQVVMMNMRDGSVQGHAAYCGDLKRGVSKFAEPAQADDVMDVIDKSDAWLDYNSDFLAEEGEHNAYDIDWLPCAKHIPEGDNHAKYLEAFGGEEAEEATAETTMKVCGKWTRFYQNGVEVGRVANDAADAVFALIRA